MVKKNTIISIEAISNIVHLMTNVCQKLRQDHQRLGMSIARNTAQHKAQRVAGRHRISSLLLLPLLMIM